MDIQRTRTRLRRTFHYPDDDGDDPDGSRAGSPEAMDEEEQEALIRTLAEQNRARDAQFRAVLLALPLLSAVPYLVALFRPASPSSLPVQVAVLSISSLLSTACLLHALPPSATGFPLLDDWRRRGESDGAVTTGGGARSAASGNSASFLAHQQPQAARPPPSPLQAYLPYLNLALCALLSLTGLLGWAMGHSGDSSTSSSSRLALTNLPTSVYAAVLAAKVLMAGVDPEKELGGLRYEYKGA